MSPKKVKALTINVGQLEKNPILALSTSEKDVASYARVVKTYGTVTPAIVGQHGSTYRILSGQARLLACAQHKIKEMPVIIATTENEAEQMKLALLLSTIKETGRSLSEGAFIQALMTQEGVSRRDIMALTGKSKSWISKRQSLASKLTDAVKGMVKDGTLCARSAEEIAKLPSDKQIGFAGTVVREGLNKTNVGKLVRLYTQEDMSEARRETILGAPLVALETMADTPSKRQGKAQRSMEDRITGNAHFLVKLMNELKGLLSLSDPQILYSLRRELTYLETVMTDLRVVIAISHQEVSPGKPHKEE